MPVPENIATIVGRDNRCMTPNGNEGYPCLVVVIENIGLEHTQPAQCAELYSYLAVKTTKSNMYFSSNAKRGFPYGLHVYCIAKLPAYPDYTCANLLGIWAYSVIAKTN